MKILEKAVKTIRKKTLKIPQPSAFHTFNKNDSSILCTFVKERLKSCQNIIWMPGSFRNFCVSVDLKKKISWLIKRSVDLYNLKIILIMIADAIFFYEKVIRIINSLTLLQKKSDISMLIIQLIVIDVAPLTVLFCICVLLKNISFSTKCLLVWCD